MGQRSISIARVSFPLEADIYYRINRYKKKKKDRILSALDIYRFRIPFSGNSMSEINEAIERIRNNPNSSATCAVRDKERILSHWLAVGKPSRWLSRVRKYRNVAVQLFQGTKGKAWGMEKTENIDEIGAPPSSAWMLTVPLFSPLFLASSLAFFLRCFLPAGSRFHHSSPLLLLSPNTYLGTSFPSCFSSVLLLPNSRKFKKSKPLLLFRYFDIFQIVRKTEKKTDQRDLVSWNNFSWIFSCAENHKKMIDFNLFSRVHRAIPSFHTFSMHRGIIK